MTQAVIQPKAARLCLRAASANERISTFCKRASNEISVNNGWASRIDIGNAAYCHSGREQRLNPGE